MKTPILEIKNFQKDFRSYWTFQKKPAVRDLNLSVNAGEAYGFLGHNGAGKTTTMKCILGLISITKGEILYDGKSVADSENRSEIGYLPEQPYFYDHLTVKETLEFFADLLGITDRKRVNEVILELGLSERINQKVRQLSKGWQQRLGVAQAILNQPKLLILDEPFSGLDPLGRRMLKELFFKLKSQGCTLFMSSHVLSDVSEICDRVAIMSKGKLVKQITLKEWDKETELNYELAISGFSEPDFQELTKNSINSNNNKERGIIHYSNYESASSALNYCLINKLQINAFEKKSPTLEEIFIKITEEKRGE